MAKNNMKNIITTEAIENIVRHHGKTASCNAVINACMDHLRIITDTLFNLVESGVEMDESNRHVICRMMNGEDVTADELIEIKDRTTERMDQIKEDLEDIFRRTKLLIGAYVSKFTPAKADDFAKKLIVQYTTLKTVMSYNIAAAERNGFSFSVPGFENHNVLIEAVTSGMNNTVSDARKRGILPGDYFDTRYEITKIGTEKYRVVQTLGPISGDTQKKEVKVRLLARGKWDKERSVYVTGCRIPGSKYVYILEEDLRDALGEDILISRVDFVDPVEIAHDADFSKLKTVGVLRQHGYSATIDDERKRRSILLRMRRAGVAKADVVRALKFLYDSSTGRSRRAAYQDVYFQDWKYVMANWPVTGEVSEAEDIRLFDRNICNI